MWFHCTFPSLKRRQNHPFSAVFTLILPFVSRHINMKLFSICDGFSPPRIYCRRNKCSSAFCHGWHPNQMLCVPKNTVHNFLSFTFPKKNGLPLFWWEIILEFNKLWKFSTAISFCNENGGSENGDFSPISWTKLFLIQLLLRRSRWATRWRLDFPFEANTNHRIDCTSQR